MELDITMLSEISLNWKYTSFMFSLIRRLHISNFIHITFIYV